MAEPKKITELWAWVCTEPDGGEGVPASGAIMPGVLLPLMGADAERMKSLEAHARMIAAASGYPIRLERFHGSALMEKLADLALRLAELAEIEVRGAELEGTPEKEALGRLGKASGLIEASQLLQSAVKEHL